MKFTLRLYYILSLLCILASCDSDTPESACGEKVSFDASSLSRASDGTGLDCFSVFGDAKLVTESNVVPVILFNNVEVRKHGNVWEYDGTQYWIPWREHSFVAISPLSVVENENAVKYSNSCLSLTYSLPLNEEGDLSDYRKVPDILSATHRRLYQNDQGSTTTLHFSHIMAKINVLASFDDNVLKEDECVEFLGISFNGIKTGATLNITPAPLLSGNQTNDWDINFTDFMDSPILRIQFEDPIKVLNNNTTIGLFDENTGIIMIPQTFASDSDAEISITYTLSYEPGIKQVTIPLKGYKWDVGKGFNLKLTFSKKGPHFESTVINDWDKCDSGEFNVE